MPELEHEARNLAGLGEVFKYVLRGRDGLALAILHGHGETQVLEEHFAKLLGRVDVEPAAGQTVDALADAFEFLPESRGKTIKDRRIDPDAILFHAKQYRRERQ